MGNEYEIISLIGVEEMVSIPEIIQRERRWAAQENGGFPMKRAAIYRMSALVKEGMLERLGDKYKLTPKAVEKVREEALIELSIARCRVAEAEAVLRRLGCDAA